MTGTALTDAVDVAPLVALHGVAHTYPGPPAERADRIVRMTDRALADSGQAR